MFLEMTCLCSETNCFSSSTCSATYMVIIMDAKQALLTVKEFTSPPVLSLYLLWCYTLPCFWNTSSVLRDATERWSENSCTQVECLVISCHDLYAGFCTFERIKISCRHILQNRQSYNIPFTSRDDHASSFDVRLCVVFNFNYMQKVKLSP